MTAADGTTKIVSFTINGANDAAVIGTPTVVAVTEDVAVSAGNLTAVGTISITDADTGENHFRTTVAGAAGNLGSLVLAADGSYTYTVPTPRFSSSPAAMPMAAPAPMSTPLR